MKQDLIRGHTYGIILACLMEGEDYGYRINKKISERTTSHFELKEATLYTAFRRLEETGLITSRWGEEERGARRRYYCITDAGREESRKVLAEWWETRDILDQLLTEVK